MMDKKPRFEVLSSFHEALFIADYKNKNVLNVVHTQSVINGVDISDKERRKILEELCEILNKGNDVFSVVDLTKRPPPYAVINAIEHTKHSGNTEEVFKSFTEWVEWCNYLEGQIAEKEKSLTALYEDKINLIDQLNKIQDKLILRSEGWAMSLHNETELLLKELNKK